VPDPVVEAPLMPPASPPEVTSRGLLLRGRRSALPQVLWLVLLLPYLLGPVPLFKVTGVVLLILVAIGYNLITGYAGQFIVVSAAVMGVGAYATAFFLGRWNIPVLPAVLLASCLSSALGALTGMLTVRLSGIYLALMSVGLAQAAVIAMQRWTSVTGGENGLPVNNVSIAGQSPPSPVGMYTVVLVATVLGLIVSWRLVSGQWGRLLKAVAHNELAARSAGIDVEATKRTVLVVGFFYFGLAGSLSALLNRFLAPDDFNLTVAINHLAMLVIGGMGTFIGPVLGAIVVGGVPKVLTFSQGYQTVLFAIAVFVVVMFVPEGLAAGPRRLWQSLRRNVAMRASALRGQG
jgi:branched-chain amino acid transport system permease protein